MRVAREAPASDALGALELEGLHGVLEHERILAAAQRGQPPPPGICEAVVRPALAVVLQQVVHSDLPGETAGAR